MKFSIFAAAVILLVLGVSSAYGQTVEEKKAYLSGREQELSYEQRQLLIQINDTLMRNREAVAQLNEEAARLYVSGSSEAAYKLLVDKRRMLVQESRDLEQQWRQSVVGGETELLYALWQLPESTIGQIVSNFGAQDYVYVMPPEIAQIKLSIDSTLPVPYGAWDSMLLKILAENGIGVRQLNSYLRQLYLFIEDQSALSLITESREQLALAPDLARVGFFLDPDPFERRRLTSLLERFANLQKVAVHGVGTKILIVGCADAIRELLKLYDFAVEHRSDREYAIVPLLNLDAEEVSKVISAIFEQLPDSVAGSQPVLLRATDTQKGGAGKAGVLFSEKTKSDDGSLKIISLHRMAQAVFLIGTREEIRRAQEIIKSIEQQVGGRRRKEIWWYTAKHSQAADLAKILSGVYNQLIASSIGLSEKQPAEGRGGPPEGEVRQNATTIITPPTEVNSLDHGPYYMPGRDIVKPSPILPGEGYRPEQRESDERFIVDEKSGSIIMVVESDLIPLLKELLRKIDIPKKMVQIEVLLFEKRLEQRSDSGLNLLRVGDTASQTHLTGATWNDIAPLTGGSHPENLGIFEFVINRVKGSGIPAYDFLYKFLITQEGIQINSSPSVVTMNQTPAKIAIVEEISVNTGTIQVPTNTGVSLERKFERAQYGITIEVMPTIHMPDEEPRFANDIEYITLDSKITFETIQARADNRPDVTTRHITNQVRIPDGQTVVIGGLRRKTTQDTKEAIPFLGELPGVGKLFSMNTMDDTNSEMFLFITPKIISDPIEDFDRLRMEHLSLRPGDTPYFLCRLVAARNAEQERLLKGSMRLLVGRQPERCICPRGTPHGR